MFDPETNEQAKLLVDKWKRMVKGAKEEEVKSGSKPEPSEVKDNNYN